MQKFLIVLIVFFLGAAGGMWAQAFLLPFMASAAAFQDLQVVKDWNARQVFVQPVTRIEVQEGEAVERIAERVQETVVAVRSASGSTGSGFIATSDGLIVTLASLAPQGYGVTVHMGSETLTATVLKRDLQNNLALLSVDRSGLRTAGFASDGDLKPATSLLFAGKILEAGEVSAASARGVLHSKSEGTFATDIFETLPLNGSPVFTLQERIAGLGFIDRWGRVHAVSTATLREFLGL